jgi:hypothetical protein
MAKELKEQRVDQLPVVEESFLEEVASHIESQSETRRRFIKKAIATAPLILTVTAGPVWARNCTPSGLLSGNLSKADGPPCCGCTPGYWKNHTNKWIGLIPEMLWTDAFPCSGYELDLLTLEMIFDNTAKVPASPIEQFGFHAVAALLNALSALDRGCTFISVAEVKQIVCDAYGTGLMNQVVEDLTIMNEFNSEWC